MVYITGDCHSEFYKLGVRAFPEQKEMTREDFVIVSGDFGGIWKDDPEERYWLKWLSEKPFTLLFIDGNHENFDRLYGEEFPVVDYHGGKAHRIRENIYHLMRGYVFELCGKSFFVFGGASSHDISDGVIDKCDFRDTEEFKKTCKVWERTKKQFRINHESWWEQELPDQEEMERGRASLASCGNQVDYVISHCLPGSMLPALPQWDGKSDRLTEYFDELLQKGLRFQMWYCGHYHREARIEERFRVLYHHIVRIL